MELEEHESQGDLFKGVSQNEIVQHRRRAAIGIVGILALGVLFSTTVLSGEYSVVEQSTTNVPEYDLIGHFFPENTPAVCNDGSPAAYYLREGDPERWVVYFEGTQTWFDSVMYRVICANNSMLVASFRF